MIYTDIHTHVSHPTAYPRVLNVDCFTPEFSLMDYSGPLSLGIHPWKVDQLSDISMALSLVSGYVRQPAVVFVGECGLDKNAGASGALQMQVFASMIELSEELRKPLIVHCVGRMDELLAARRDASCLWIVHGFRGKPAQAEQLMSRGISLSFGDRYNPGSVLVTPPDRLYIESDDREIAIPALYREIAKLKKIDVSELDAGCRLLNSLL